MCENCPSRYEKRNESLTPPTLLFDSESGYYERVNLVAGSYVPTGQRIGMQLTQPLQPVGVAEEIRFFRFAPEDVGRFQGILDWMKKLTPQWYQFVLQQRPLDLYLNPQLKALGWAGSAACCWGFDHARIEFEHRPPQDVFGDLYYVVSLVHESQHVADYRAKKPFIQGRSVDACRAAERSATETERVFLVDLLKTQIYGQDRDHAMAYLQFAEDKLAKNTFDWNPACRD